MYRTRLRRLILLAAAAALTGLAVAGCSTSPSDQGGSPTSHSASASSSQHADSSTSGRGHMHGGPVPAGMHKAAHPKYPVGSTVILTADHMSGMKGAHATVVGAYDTTTYALTYTPTTGGPPVKDHKWVVQQEIKKAPPKPLPDGTKVTLTADHMPGMKGAHATIVSSTTQPVYVVNYTAHGKTVKNHKWVVQDEIKPAS